MNRAAPCATCGGSFPSVPQLLTHERRTGHQRDYGHLLAAMSDATSSGCLEFRGRISDAGYRMIGDNGTHRLAYEAAFGPIPAGMQVCHTCDNPPCVNPAHLFLGTVADNYRDSMEKGRHSHGEGHGRARLTEADVLAIRASTESKRVLARRFGVSRGTIGFVRNRQTWAHL